MDGTHQPPRQVDNAGPVGRRRPFDDNGGGYRDNLIWQTILDLAGKYGDDIVLVSGDKSFQDESGKLHSDLLQEIAERGLNGQIQLYPKLAELILDSLVDHQLAEGESLEAYATDLRLSPVPEWIEEHILDAILDVAVDKRAG